MKYNRVGNSGLYVSELTLGTMIFGEDSDRSTPEDDAIRMVHRFIDLGGTHLDTANVYAGGQSEEIVGKALSGSKRQKVTIATKVRYGVSAKEDSAAGLSRQAVMGQVEQSLRRMGTEVIDLYYMHGYDPHTPLEESLRAFEDLVRQGKVRYIGVSNFKAWQVMKSLGISDRHGWVRFVAGQYQYSLVVRDVEYEFKSLFEEEGIGMMPWGPLGGGFLSGKYQRGERPSSGRIATTASNTEEAWSRRSNERNWNIIDAVGEVAEALGATYPQIALAWLKAQPTVSSVIIGARTLEQFEDNMGAVAIDLTDDELDKLDNASKLPEIYPYRMIREYGLE